MLDSPRKLSPYLILPLVAFLVLYGCCVDMESWSGAGLPEAIVLWAWSTVWKNMSCLTESHPSLSRSFFLDQNLLKNPHTVLAAVSCCTWRIFSRYCWAPPHTLIRYTSLLITAPFAIISFVLKEAFLAIFFSPLTLVVSCFTMDLLWSLMWRFHCIDWWRWQPRSFSDSVGSIVWGPAWILTWFLLFAIFLGPSTSRCVLSAFITNLLPLIHYSNSLNFLVRTSDRVVGSECA